MGDDHDVALATRRPAPQRALLANRGTQPDSGHIKWPRTGYSGRPLLTLYRIDGDRVAGAQIDGIRGTHPGTDSRHRSERNTPLSFAVSADRARISDDPARVS